MIELCAVEVDVEGKRALDSANYTLTERSGLTLFRLDWRDPEQGDEWSDEFNPAAIDTEFWATSAETAIDELKHNVTLFILCGCDKYCTDVGMLHEGVRRWVEQVRPELLALDFYAGVADIIQMEEHVAYVTRKMAELVDLLDESDLLDGITDFYHP